MIEIGEFKAIDPTRVAAMWIEDYSVAHDRTILVRLLTIVMASGEKFTVESELADHAPRSARSIYNAILTASG